MTLPMSSQCLTCALTLISKSFIIFITIIIIIIIIIIINQVSMFQGPSRTLRNKNESQEPLPSVTDLQLISEIINGTIRKVQIPSQHILQPPSSLQGLLRATKNQTSATDKPTHLECPCFYLFPHLTDVCEAAKGLTTKDCHLFQNYSRAFLSIQIQISVVVIISYV